ncbi:MAG: dockerin type I repeat-containing protein [Prevotellaceae bacterium]|nr:dockerin type I repeat-containing protein [Prevotellaceae bacterium]
MKKLLSLSLFLLATNGLMAQTYNLFDASDVDADGWLWFDTQAKIDKYVGLINEEDFCVDPNGKLIQMVYGDQVPDYPETYADPDAVGVGEDGEDYGSLGAKTGAIIIAPASAMMSTNGGGIVFNLPCCSTISVFLSSESRILAHVKGANDVSKNFNEYWRIYMKNTVFTPLTKGAGQIEWTGIESSNNGTDNETFTFVSDDPKFCFIQSCNKYPVYVHGVKITTPRQVGPIGPTVKLGDANSDGSVDVGDITTIAAYILGNNPTPFDAQAADANQDNAIDVGDITATAGIILGK